MIGTPVFVVMAALGGAATGLAAGWAGVRLEVIEGLEDEENEERTAYEREVLEAAGRARDSGDPEPSAAAWHSERYGWTWLERIASPVLAAAAFALFAARERGAGLAVHLLWMVLFTHIIIFDLKHRLILNRITYPSVVAALALSPLSPGLTLPRALAGATAVGSFFLLQYVVSRGSIGLGDAKLGALVGAVTGLGFDGVHLGAVWAVIWAVMLGGAAALLLLVTRVRGLKDPIPYGPFLCAGATVMLYQGL